MTIYFEFFYESLNGRLLDISVMAILIGNIPYKASCTYFYVKEELGDGSLLSPNYLSTANILIRTG